MSTGVRISAASLGTLSKLADGGQGVVYATPLKLRHLALPLVFKEYKSTIVGSLNVGVLEAMPTYLEGLPFNRGMELLSQAAWPCRLVEETSGRIKGFVMPAIPSEFYLTMKKASGVSKEVGEFQHLLNSNDFLARRQIALSDRGRYDLLIEVARALVLFHGHKIAVGDLSPKNLLFSLSPSAKVFFLDCDAMRFQGRSSMPQFETPGWEVVAANHNEQLGTSESDSYKLGLLALRLLVGDQDTRDPNRLPRSVPKPVRDLITHALRARPTDRPPPADWIAALRAAASQASTKPQGSTKPPTPPTPPHPPTAPGHMPTPTRTGVSPPQSRTRKLVHLVVAIGIVGATAYAAGLTPASWDLSTFWRSDTTRVSETAVPDPAEPPPSTAKPVTASDSEAVDAYIEWVEHRSNRIDTLVERANKINEDWDLGKVRNAPTHEALTDLLADTETLVENLARREVPEGLDVPSYDAEAAAVLVSSSSGMISGLEDPTTSAGRLASLDAFRQAADDLQQSLEAIVEAAS